MQRQGILNDVPRSRRSGPRIALVVAALLCVHCAIAEAQETFPPNRTRGELDAQILQLEEQSRAVEELMRANARRMFDGLDRLVSRGADGILGPFFGREREYVQLQKTVEELDLALRSGSSTFAVAKAREAYRQGSDLFKRLVGALSGKVSPTGTIKQFLESGRDLAEAARGATTVAETGIQDEHLKSVLAGINRNIDRLRQEQSSSRYERQSAATKRPPKPPPTPPESTQSGDELDDAIKLLDWLDKGNRSFSGQEEKEHFYTKFPELRRFDQIAEFQSPADEVADMRQRSGTGAGSDKATKSATADARDVNEAKMATELLAAGGSYTPPKPGSATAAAREVNEAKVATELLAAGGSYTPPTPGTPEFAAWQANQIGLGVKRSGQDTQLKPPTPGTPEFAAWQVARRDNAGTPLPSELGTSDSNAPEASPTSEFTLGSGRGSSTAVQGATPNKLDNGMTGTWSLDVDCRSLTGGGYCEGPGGIGGKVVIARLDSDRFFVDLPVPCSKTTRRVVTTLPAGPHSYQCSVGPDTISMRVSITVKGLSGSMVWNGRQYSSDGASSRPIHVVGTLVGRKISQ